MQNIWVLTNNAVHIRHRLSGFPFLKNQIYSQQRLETFFRPQRPAPEGERSAAACPKSHSSRCSLNHTSTPVCLGLPPRTRQPSSGPPSLPQSLFIASLLQGSCFPLIDFQSGAEIAVSYALQLAVKESQVHREKRALLVKAKTPGPKNPEALWLPGFKSGSLCGGPAFRC